MLEIYELFFRAVTPHFSFPVIHFVKATQCLKLDAQWRYYAYSVVCLYFSLPEEFSMTKFGTVISYRRLQVKMNA
jgi:hypothetical protein